MSSPRDGAYANLRSNRELLIAALAPLTPEQMTVTAVDRWLVKDILAHLTSWEQIILIDLERIKLGRTPANYCRGTDDWNEFLMLGHENFGLEQVMTEFAETRDAVMQTLDEIPEEAFAFGDLLGNLQIMATHDWQHATDIKAWCETSVG
ncbi:MAG TPA: DinB family protein [Dehalococcoidia bacterium]|nr:DinB family protein [Dehalococcoidia bacterium]